MKGQKLIDLNDYFYFVHVVEKGSISAAARALEMPKSRVSRHISQLENRLQLRLLQRNSRHMSVTEVGQQFYQHARQLVDNMEQAELAVAERLEVLSGSIKISCSVGIAQFGLQQLLCEFLLKHPEVEVHQHVSNSAVDLIAEGIDLAIRGHSGPLPDSNLIQKNIATVEWQIFASRKYIEQQGLPETPYDLYQHAFLKLGWQHSSGILQLKNREGIQTSIPIEAKFNSDDMYTLIHACLSGIGLVALPAYTCIQQVNDGQLLRVLPEWTAGMASLSLLMPSRTGVSPATRALMDFIQQELPNYLHCR